MASFLKSGIDIYELQKSVTNYQCVDIYTNSNDYVREMSGSKSARTSQYEDHDYERNTIFIWEARQSISQFSGTTDEGSTFKITKRALSDGTFLNSKGEIVDTAPTESQEISAPLGTLDLPDQDNSPIYLIDNAPYVIANAQNKGILAISNLWAIFRNKSILCQSAKGTSGVLEFDARDLRNILKNIEFQSHALFEKGALQRPRTSPGVPPTESTSNVYADEGPRDFGSTPEGEIPSNLVNYKTVLVESAAAAAAAAAKAAAAGN